MSVKEKMRSRYGENWENKGADDQSLVAECENGI